MLTGKLKGGSIVKKEEKMQALRLTKKEQKDVNKKWMEFNKIIVNAGGAPLTESEFLHEILRLAVPKVKINNSKQMYLEIE
tara:strand:+ start:706 stop:948 length:243 start_codon:yes stop_codon:yes gene_type:complete